MIMDFGGSSGITAVVVENGKVVAVKFHNFRKLTDNGGDGQYFYSWFIHVLARLGRPWNRLFEIFLAEDLSIPD